MAEMTGSLEFIKTGILGYGEDYFEDALMEPPYFWDLNLDQIIKCVQEERKEYDMRRYFFKLPNFYKIALERILVLRALENEEVLNAFLQFSDNLLLAREYARRYRHAMFDLQRQRFLLDCGAAYVKGVEILSEMFKNNAETISASQLLSSLRETLTEYAAAPEYQKLRSLTKELSEEFADLRVQMIVARDKAKITQEISEENYSSKLKRLFPEQAWRDDFLENPFQTEKEPGEFEKLILAVFCKNNPSLFKKLKEYEKCFSQPSGTASPKGNVQNSQTLAGKQEPENGKMQVLMQDWILTLEQQVQVYIAYRLFIKRMAVSGYPFAYPVFTGTSETVKTANQDMESPEIFETIKTVNQDIENSETSETIKTINQDMENPKIPKTINPAPNTKHAEKQRNPEKMTIINGYDLALLLKSMYSKQHVVCNDACYSGSESFFIVTGPNQGGKTTFARSIGQIVYFSLMGLAAPCESAVLPFFNGILTHFSVEESLETGRGKLKEELVRLKPMMKEQEQNKFVVINELFTTAATYDAYIMGKRVIEHFMEQNCLGIYVTHISELADEAGIGKEGKNIVSLSACVDAEDAHIRTFRIIRSLAAGTGYAYGIVEKYHLTYSEVKERLFQRLKKDGGI